MNYKYMFSNVIGKFVFNSRYVVIGKGKIDKKKYPSLKDPDNEELLGILSHFKDKKYFKDFYEQNMLVTKRKVKESVNEDMLINQAINSIVELDRASNMLVKRLREWYSLYNPEFSHELEDHEKFVELVATKKKIKDSMGADLDKSDIDEILKLAKELASMYKLRDSYGKYLEKIMKKYCPNMQTLAGTLVGAKLIESAGSLKRMVMMPASTIQLLGAEKALFRHMKTKARCPKHGLIVNHPLVASAKKSERGKAARVLADKISIAVKVDYYKGKFVGDRLKKEVEAKLK